MMFNLSSPLHVTCSLGALTRVEMHSVFISSHHNHIYRKGILVYISFFVNLFMVGAGADINTSTPTKLLTK